jgi:D-alanyl-D-alanine carboxypeptidase/D-alanyl-D-alanine-endopeptidase (penicillin-binding protein 4)
MISAPIRSISALAAAALLCVPCAAGIIDNVKEAIRSAQIKNATVAVSVRDADTDETVVSINASAAMIPASNMKLLTTGAALHALGPDFQFKTRLLREGDRITVVGDGDPGFGDPDLLKLMTVGQRTGMDFDEFLKIWIDAVKAAGISHISELVVDDRVFDRQFTHPDWPADQLNLHYCAQTAGLSVHLNVFHFFPRPIKGGAPSIADFRPRAPWIVPTNKATSKGGSKDRNTMYATRVPGTNRLTMFGNAKSAYQEPLAVTIHDPPSFFAQLLATRLGAAGVKVDSFRVVDPAAPSSSGEILGPVVCTPLSTAITVCNRESQNFYAECLLKRLAYAATREPGSWLQGGNILRHIVHERLEGSSITPELVVSDGSGMSRKNFVSAGTMTAWLDTFHRDPRLGEMFITSIPNQRTSDKLAARFRDENLHGATVHAKTGYINQVCCLSGYVTMPDGRRRSFSILVNGLPADGSVGKAKHMQDDIVASIARDMAETSITLGSD